MTTSLDDDLVPAALELVNDFGTDLVFRVPAQGMAYDVETGETVGRVDATARKASPPQGVTDRMVNGDTIRVGDQYFVVAASGITFEPCAGMEVDFDGVRWQITDVRKLRSGDQVAAYKCVMRR